ncbi:MAG TPA: hypothetical protein VK614_12835 [Allosphingosinicella sp.]|nr:hypothetical protein [Allosphingosinicella sp.]
MMWALLLAAIAAGTGASDVPNGRAAFAGMSDLQIDGWLRWNGFYHGGNVYRCRGLSHESSSRRLTRALGPDYDARHGAISRLLRARYGDQYVEQADFLLFGYGINPHYCRRIRFVVSDLLRGTAELERRLGIVR